MAEVTGFWSRVGRAITRLRNFILNSIFVLLLVFVFFALIADDGPTVPNESALVIDPRGVLVNQRSLNDPLAQFLAPDSAGEVEVGEVTEALQRAAEDDRIHMAVLDLDQLLSSSADQARVIGSAIQDFQATGKEVIAYNTGFSQAQYLIASFADTVYMHPMGQLMLPGYGSNQLYFKELLDKIDVNLHIFRVGKYKGFVEPYIRSDMSEDARFANQTLIDELWSDYTDRVIENRSLDPAEFEAFTQSLPTLLAAMGDLATVAMEHHLVDELLTHDEARARIADEVGYATDGEFTRIGFEDYLSATTGKTKSGSLPAIGVITANGPIMMGRQSQRVIAADTLMNLIRRARQNEDIKALVLQVNSPGGSAFAAEMIRQELELLQLSGKPVVVSMDSVAASGGYWISATADRILAQPTTVTGSIGVFGLFPTFEDTLAELGVTSDGVGTTPLSRSLDPFAGLSADMANILQLNVEQIYEQFLNLVARGRDMTPDAVNEIAQGRVWSGSMAKELGLVDQFGSMDDALALAAELAEIGDYRIETLRPSFSARDLLLSSLGNIRSELVAHPLLRQLSDAEALLSTLNDPGSGYALCEICLQTSNWRR